MYNPAHPYPPQYPPQWPYPWPIPYPGQMSLVPRQMGEPKNIPPGKHPADHMICPPPNRTIKRGGHRKMEDRNRISGIDWEKARKFYWEDKIPHPWDRREEPEVVETEEDVVERY